MNGDTDNAGVPETSGSPAETKNEDRTGTGLDYYSWAMRNEGAFSAFLALSHVLEDTSAYVVRTKKQYVAFVNSLLELLLTNACARDAFLDYSGECDIKIDADTCEVKSIRPPYERRGSE